MEYSQIVTSSEPKSKRNHKADKDFAKKLDLKDIKFQVKVRDIQRIEKNPSASNLCIKQNAVKKSMLIYYYQDKKERDNMFMSKALNRFMYDGTFYHGRKQFCLYCLKAFSREKILKHHI